MVVVVLVGMTMSMSDAAFMTWLGRAMLGRMGLVVCAVSVVYGCNGGESMMRSVWCG